MKFRARTLGDIADHFDEMKDRNAQRVTELGGERKHPTREMIECAARATAFALAAEVIRDTELEGHAPAPRKRRSSVPPASGDAQ